MRRGAGGAIARHGRPEVFDADQGSPFTGHDSTDVPNKAGIAISVDGKDVWRDDILVERPWRSVRYEEVHLGAYDMVAEAQASIGRYPDSYDARRPRSSLDRRTPDQAYLTRLPRIAAA